MSKILIFKTKMTHICLIWDQKFTNLDGQTVISFPMSANKTD